VYFVEGILDMASLAVSYYLKDTLGLGPSAVGVSALWYLLAAVPHSMLLLLHACTFCMAHAPVRYACNPTRMVGFRRYLVQRRSIDHGERRPS
jgi:hypothetical protein